MARKHRKQKPRKVQVVIPPADVNRLVCADKDVELFTEIDRLDIDPSEKFAVQMTAGAIRCAHKLSEGKPLDQMSLSDLLMALGLKQAGG